MDEQTAVHENLIRETPATRLGQRLRRARLARNLTQGEVAKNLFSVSYVSAVERGQIRPSLGALERLAERLQVQVTELLGTGEFQPSGPISGGVAESVSERVRDDIDTRLREARKLTRQGGPQATSQAIEILLRLSGQALGQRELGRIDLLLAQCYLAQRRGEDARRAAQAGLTVSERLGDRDLAERLRLELGHAAAMLQSPSLALEHYRRALEAIERGEVQDLVLQLGVVSSLGSLLSQIGEAELALEYLQRAAQIAKEVSRPERLGDLFWAMSLAYATRGDASEARQYAQKSIAAFEEANIRQMIASVYQALGRAYSESGRFDDAVAELRQAGELAAAQQNPAAEADALRQLAQVYIRENKQKDASDAAASAIRKAEEAGDDRAQAQALLTLARIQQAQKHAAEAERSFERAIQLLQDASASDVLGDALSEFADFLEGRGNTSRAYEVMKEAKGAYAASARAAIKL
ncbi:MAG TPA: tetratricopeptide repeat protein [Ktedonobacterales bacterium]|jgi:tetratricopeptide (TPR) repeat protein|nr:tetratricopeptide repeat protein [Ktedonobacterales bacterium]